ncbi:hypothetical protein ASC97_07000 [Rhizobium sp. Root1203]|uniref:hypothetical protein n=1 Tax=Rhizobium sp. Root1203 TaxID=1736427 RepID=UPI00070E40FA|nr:hypothetical protein [Rhizobium sp. Root1203]KQV28089.1 hypothetical protein ASC97_07000 [Rhizobium sp. Root1203]
MADFDLPFADSGERRFPTTDEQANGFGCGPASLPLFNGMFWAIQAEIGAVINSAGISQSNASMTQLLQAIQALIAAATGNADTSAYLLTAQARARLPIFPEVLNTNGHFGVTSPATGQVRIPAGVSFQHRGIFPLTTVQTDFATDASKTYHIRWNPTDGFTLKDLANNVYNPAVVAETDSRFDSTYDDMLVARVITNSSNVPTITNLVNKDRLTNLILDIQTLTRVTTSIGNWVVAYTSIPINWARTPKATGHMARVGYSTVLLKVPEEPALVLAGSATDNTGTATAGVTRYNFSPIGTIDTNETTPTSRTFSIQLSATLIA